MNTVIYLDNAATTFPKPQKVLSEVMRCMKVYCGNPGRGGHRMSLMASEKVYECRTLVSDLYHSSVPENVIFTQNTTSALNTAIKAFAGRGDHIVISSLEHNSSFRPVVTLSRRGCRYSIFDASTSDPDVIIRNIRSVITPSTRLIVTTHLSNICGIRMPVEAIGRFCRERGINYIVDAAQSAGSLDIDINRAGIDAICAPGHKGLYGPQGSGFILFSDKYSEERRSAMLSTFMEGGNGVNSYEDHMPDFLPERFEAGTLSTPAIAGLAEGIKVVNKIGINEIADHANRLRRRLTEMLLNTNGFTVYMPYEDCGGTVLFNIDGKNPADVASALNNAGICVRSGYHCCPLGHETLMTGEEGAIRVSFSIFNTSSEIEQLYKNVRAFV